MALVSFVVQLIVPSPHIEFPVFRSNLQFYKAPYRLAKICIHFGDAPTLGHYRAILYTSDGGSSQAFITDDGVDSRAISFDAVMNFRHDMYLFFYIRCS